MEDRSAIGNKLHSKEADWKKPESLTFFLAKHYNCLVVTTSALLLHTKISPLVI